MITPKHIWTPMSNLLEECCCVPRSGMIKHGNERGGPIVTQLDLSIVCSVIVKFPSSLNSSSSSTAANIIKITVLDN